MFPASFDPRLALLASGDHGEFRIAHNVENTAVDIVVAAWTETLTDAGYTPREPCTETATHACVWTGRDRLVVTAAWPDRRGTGIDVSVHWLPAGHVPVKRLPGACVIPPVIRRSLEVLAEGTDQSGDFRSSSTRHDVVTRPGADVDGDGRRDVFVPHAKQGDCPWEVPLDVYVMRGDCGYRIGTIVGDTELDTHLAGFHRGIRRIFTEASWATRGMDSPIPERHSRTRAYTFDGRRLKKTADETKSGQCHHCGVLSCSER